MAMTRFDGYRGGLVAAPKAYRGWLLCGSRWQCVCTADTAAECRRFGAKKVLLHPLEPDPPATDDRTGKG